MARAHRRHFCIITGALEAVLNLRRALLRFKDSAVAFSFPGLGVYYQKGLRRVPIRNISGVVRGKDSLPGRSYNIWVGRVDGCPNSNIFGPIEVSWEGSGSSCGRQYEKQYVASDVGT